MANPAFCSGHREPDAALAAGVVDDLDSLSRLRGEDLRERRVICGVRHDDRRRHRSLDVVLLEKGGDDFGELPCVRVLRKERAVAHVPATADHHDVDSHDPLLRRRRDYVDVAGGRTLDELARLQLREPRDLVAQPRRALEGERCRRLVHLHLELRQHLVGLALQEQDRTLHVLAIIGLRDEADARRAAPLDLVQHARPRPVREHRVLAGAQLKDLLQERHPLAHGARARERTEVAVLAVEAAAVEAQLREPVAGEAHVGIALVVAEEDVVARFLRLDQVVLEEQRLAFRARHRRLDARDLREHHGDPRLVRTLLEVARHALLQVARLADVERRAGGIEHPVDARAVRQRRDQLSRVERRRRRGGRFTGACVHVRQRGARVPFGAGTRRCPRTRRGTSAP